METNLYIKIEADAIFSEHSRVLIKEIKKFSVKHYNKKFEPGVLTLHVLEDLLKDIEESEKNGRHSNYGIMVKIAIHKYLDLDPIFEIGLKS